MYQENIESKVYNEIESNHNHKKAPHRKLVDAIIGLAVVSIVMNSLFLGVWWALIVQIVLFIHVIDEVLKLAKKTELRKNYRYRISQKQLINHWIGAIIVSIVMNAFFAGVWFAEIPVVILNIEAIVITIEFIKTREQDKKETQRVQAPPKVFVHHSSMNNSNAQATAIYQTMEYTSVSSQDATNLESSIIRYCSMCGQERRGEASYCPACGSEF